MTTYFIQNDPEQFELFEETALSEDLFQDSFDEDWLIDSSSDAEALASAGFGTDEDYGYWGPGG